MTLEPTTYRAPSGQEFLYWSREQLLKAWKEKSSLKVLADGCRLNAVTAVQIAGSGHLGTSLSSLDIMVAVRAFLDGDKFLTSSPSGAIFFSSKGHDAPAYYATMHLCGELKDEDLFTLRRLGGLPGHPETVTKGVPTNTGSLGMGISKAKGFIKAARLADPDSRQPLVVMLGDGELNEGQIWESMPGAVRDGFSELIAIVDGNKIQSDTWGESTLPLGDVRRRVEGAGWSYLEVEGNDPDQVLEALTQASSLDSPTFIYASTVKGSGVSWMEEFPADGEYYKFHSGAIAPELYDAAAKILVGSFTGDAGGKAAELEPSRPEFDSYHPRNRPESLLTHWEVMIGKFMDSHDSIVAFDGDLSFDTGTHLVRHQYPHRYVQAGIAEQDMVSMAGTLALSGHIPFVHSFATFLTMRATEQIFNNATEYSHIVYFGFLAGIVPSAPGFSHQAVTDVGIMSSIPGIRVFEPSCSEELAQVVEAALKYKGPSYVRIGGLGPAPAVTPPANPAALVQRRAGTDLAFVTSGPLLTLEALSAADLLAQEGIEAAVFSRPETTAEINPDDARRLAAMGQVIVCENHDPALANFHHISQALRAAGSPEPIRVGVDGVPANGQPQEVLVHHRFDAVSLASRARAGLDLPR